MLGAGGWGLGAGDEARFACELLIGPTAKNLATTKFSVGSSNPVRREAETSPIPSP